MQEYTNVHHKKQEVFKKKKSCLMLVAGCWMLDAGKRFSGFWQQASFLQKSSCF